MSAEIDTEALEAAAIKALEENIEEAEIEEVEEVQEEVEEVEEEFDLDAALNGDHPIALEGVLSEEQAKEEAANRGWVEDGKDKFGHKLSAIEFLERAPLFNTINRVKKGQEDQGRQIKQLIEQNKLIAQKSIDDKKKLNDQLKSAKDQLLSQEYLDTDDVAKLKTIDSEIEANAETVDLSPTDEQLAQDYEIAKEEFVGNNDWYQNDYKMTKKADEVGLSFAKAHYEKYGVVPPPAETFEHVLEEVEKAFPKKPSEKPKRTRVATPQHRTVAQTQKKAKTLEDIPEDQRMVAKEVMEAAGLSIEEYLKTYQF